MLHSPDHPTGGYRALVDRFPNGVLVLFDAELRYRIVGPETLPFSGRRAAEMVDRSIHDLFGPEAVADLEPQLRSTIAGDPCSFDVDHEDRVHHIETTPVQIDGDPFGVLVTQEVTEERRTAARLEQQNARLERFAGIVSHDLRNPLNVAQGRLELAREECDTDHHDAIEAALDRMDDIIEDVLWMTREGEEVGAVQSVSLVAAAESAWGMVTAEAADATLRWAAEAPEAITVSANYDRLSQLLENLLGNAVAHAGEDVTVTVGTLPDGIYVADDGPGIPAADRAAVLEAGYSTAEEGTGLGLSIVETVAEAHGWTVSVTEGADGGARFEITGMDISE